MILPITSVVFQNGGGWKFQWTSTGASSYRVVLYGQQIDTITTNSYTFTGIGFVLYPPPLEITDNSDLTPSELYTPRMVLQWYTETCDHYNISKYVSGWQQVSFALEVGDWVYTYQTPVLLDETAYRYKVEAVDALSNVSDAQEYDHFIVTPPRPPDATIVVSYTGPGTHKVQVAAA